MTANVDFLLIGQLVVLAFFLFLLFQQQENFTQADRCIKALDPKVCMCPNINN